LRWVFWWVLLAGFFRWVHPKNPPGFLGYVPGCLNPAKFGRTAGPIKTKLGIGTHVDPGSVLLKVKVIYLCVRYKEICLCVRYHKFMSATPGE